MAKEPVERSNERVETSIVPLKYVDTVEDVFHAVLALALLIIGIGAFFYTIERLITTAPFFPNGMIQGVNDILFIVIILEILRTVISRFTDGVYQLDKFLIIGVIAAVRHILTVGASVTLESGKSDQAFERAIVEMGLNALIVVALVFAIFMSKMAHRKKVYPYSKSPPRPVILGFFLRGRSKRVAITSTNSAYAATMKISIGMN